MGDVWQRGLSATWLKYFACLFMVVDHADAIFHLLGGVAGPDSLLFYLPRILGRMVFPIFAWFIAEGCQKTKSLPDYIKRLFLFALAAQIPFTMAFSALGGNVILTFFLAAAGISFYESARDWIPAPLAALLVIPVAVLAQLCDSDYGWEGVVIVFLLYLCRSKGPRLLVLAGSMAGLYFLIPALQICVTYIPPFFEGVPISYLWSDFVGSLPYWLPMYLLYTVFSLVPVGLLALYNGQRGKGNKYFFYLFYPGHLLILYIIARCIA